MYKGLGVKRPRNRSSWKNFSDHGSVVSSGRIGGGITSEVTMRTRNHGVLSSLLSPGIGRMSRSPCSRLSLCPCDRCFIFEIRSIKGDVVWKIWYFICQNGSHGSSSCLSFHRSQRSQSFSRGEVCGVGVMMCQCKRQGTR